MNERKRAQAGSDGICWYCPSCKTTKSIRTASFFSKSKLTLQKWMIAMLWWSREYPVTDMAMEADIKVDTACDIYQWLPARGLLHSAFANANDTGWSWYSGAS